VLLLVCCPSRKRASTACRRNLASPSPSLRPVPCPPPQPFVADPRAAPWLAVCSDVLDLAGHLCVGDYAACILDTAVGRAVLGPAVEAGEAQMSVLQVRGVCVHPCSLSGTAGCVAGTPEPYPCRDHPTVLLPLGRIRICAASALHRARRESLAPCAYGA
jgi:hypothetical protein